MKIRTIFWAFLIVIWVGAGAARGDEFQRVLSHIRRRGFAIAWIDVREFSLSDRVPTLGGLMDFDSASKKPSKSPSDPFIRSLKTKMPELKQAGVRRIWFVLNHMNIFNPPYTLILVCDDAPVTLKLMQKHFKGVAKEITQDKEFVIVRFLPDPDPSAQTATDAWKHVKPLDSFGKRSHGYMHRNIEYIVMLGKARRSWMNDYFNSDPELGELAEEHLSMVEYTLFVKEFPSKTYKVRCDFQSVEAQTAAKQAFAKRLQNLDSPDLKIEWPKNQFLLSTSTAEGEEQVAKFLCSIRPFSNFSLP